MNTLSKITLTLALFAGCGTAVQANSQQVFEVQNTILRDLHKDPIATRKAIRSLSVEDQISLFDQLSTKLWQKLFRKSWNTPVLGGMEEAARQVRNKIRLAAGGTMAGSAIATILSAFFFCVGQVNGDPTTMFLAGMGAVSSLAVSLGGAHAFLGNHLFYRNIEAYMATMIAALGAAGAIAIVVALCIKFIDPNILVKSVGFLAAIPVALTAIVSIYALVSNEGLLHTNFGGMVNTENGLSFLSSYRQSRASADALSNRYWNNHNLSLKAGSGESLNQVRHLQSMLGNMGIVKRTAATLMHWNPIFNVLLNTYYMHF